MNTQFVVGNPHYIAVYGSGRDAKEHANRLNNTRENNEVFGCRRTKDGRWEVIRVTTLRSSRP